MPQTLKLLFCVGNVLVATSLCEAAFAPLKSLQCRLQRNHKIAGDDFAEVSFIGDEGDLSAEEGRKLASEFYQEVQLRKKHRLSRDTRGNDVSAEKAPNNEKPPQQRAEITRSKNTEWASAGLFQKGKPRLTVYSGTAAVSPSPGRPRQKLQGRAVPLPPTPRYGSPTQLSISGAIAVVLLSRNLWVQACISVALVALYIFLITGNPHESPDWIGAGSGGWSTSISDGAPVIERSAEPQQGSTDSGKHI